MAHLNIKMGPKIGVLLEQQFLWLMSTSTVSGASATAGELKWLHSESELSESDLALCLEFLRTKM